MHSYSETMFIIILCLYKARILFTNQWNTSFVQIWYCQTFVKSANIARTFDHMGNKVKRLCFDICTITSYKKTSLADFVGQYPCIPIDSVFELANNYVSLQLWILSFGGSRTKEGVRIGVAVISPTGRVWRYSRLIDPEYSNNQAEYKELIWGGVRILLQKHVKCAPIYTDSKLVIWQMKGEYRCNTITLAKLYNSTKQLLNCFADIPEEHVYSPFICQITNLESV